MRYNVHGLASFAVADESSLVARHFSQVTRQFAGFSCHTAHAGPLDFELRLGSFSPRTKDCAVLDDKYWVRPGYIYFRGQRKLSKWAADFSISDNSVHLRVDANPVGYLTKPHFLAEFLLHWAIVKNGGAAVHAGAVERNGSGLLIAGSSGSGKTTACIALQEIGFSLLGDNYSILGQDKVYAYRSPLNLFTYNLLPAVRKRLSKVDLVDLRMREILYLVTRGYLKFLKKVPPERVVDRISTQGKAECIVFLRPVAQSALGMPTELDRGAAVKRLVANMMLEWAPLRGALLALDYLWPSNPFSAYQKRLATAIVKNLSQSARCYEIVVPERYSSRSRAELIKAIDVLVPR